MTMISAIVVVVVGLLAAAGRAVPDLAAPLPSRPRAGVLARPGLGPDGELDLLEALCRPMATAPACANETLNPSFQYCVWAGDRCAFRSRSCPPALATRLNATAHCGATPGDRCPPACRAAERDLVVEVCRRAGITRYDGPDHWQNGTRRNPAQAQVGADLTYCLYAGGVDLLNASDCAANLTADEVNAALEPPDDDARPRSAAAPVAFAVAMLLYAVVLPGLAFW